MKKILLVEDDKFLVEIYSQELKKEGFKVDVAFDGKSALKKLNEDFDLVILDIVMPSGIDGWQILEEISKKKEKEKKKLPKVVVLSNLAQKEEIKKALAMGAEKYFLKTHFEIEEVIEEIKKLLK